MKPEDLSYPQLKPALARYDEKDRGESISFLNWFLENIFRLDSITADDAICDRPNDKGIDGILVDHTQEEILVMQCKLKQRESTIGDSPLRDLVGAITQLRDDDSIQALLDGGANEELKQLLINNNIRGLVSKGYKVIGVFVCNQSLDGNGSEYLNQHDALRVYDRNRIASEFIDIDADAGIAGEYTFDASYVAPMVIRTGGRAVTYVLPIQALELVGMEGIDDGTLFSQNVRQSLGNTKVNKALRKSVENQSEHENFPLYHNGVNILCENAILEEDKLKIRGYVVVNGAQSITTFKRQSESLSENLRVIVKVTQLADDELSKKITVNSNNQNSIRPRDLKSNDEVQIRLREEFSRVEDGKYELEIKRGQNQSPDTNLITNEEAGRLLLAFDLKQPESCHQVYKLFDEKYADIFTGPGINAYRIIFLYLIMERIEKCASKITYKPLAKYGLTRFFLLSVISELLRQDEWASEYIRDPRRLFEEEIIEKFLDAIESILCSIIIDLNYEVTELGERFDYKGDLKSPNKVRELRNKLMRSYEKDVARGKTESLAELMSGT